MNAESRSMHKITAIDPGARKFMGWSLEEWASAAGRYPDTTPTIKGAMDLKARCKFTAPSDGEMNHEWCAELLKSATGLFHMPRKSWIASK